MNALGKSPETKTNPVLVLWRNLRGRPALLSFLCMTAFTFALCLMFVPRWEQNDDVCMSMAAHGYGLAAYGSPNLLYSNVLWGHLVRAVPMINGVLGYSLATVAVLWVAGWAMLYFLLRLGAGYLPSLLAVTLVMARPILFPQFTLNAGLLPVAAVLGWRVYARVLDRGSLWLACLLAFAGYLIRQHEFILVLAIALPLLPWQAIRRQRPMQIALALLTVAIAFAAAIDHWAYSGPEWKTCKALHAAIPSISDSGGAQYIKQKPEILARHGYSLNDLQLIDSKFYMDPALADPKAMNAMSAELGPLYMQKGRMKLGLEAFEKLISSMLLPVILAGLFLLGIAFRRSVAVAWAVCLSAIFAIGILFRPGVFHVNFPLMSLLLVAPLAFGPVKGIRRWITLAALLAACAGNAYVLVPQSEFSKRVMERAQKDARFFPPETIFSWGGTFPVQLIFPVLSNDLQLRKLRWHSINSFTPAPFSVATADQKMGRGMLDLWRTEKGISVIESPLTLNLSAYCRERCRGQLQVAPTRRMPIVSVQKIRCVTKQ